jgi:redox-sensing transcriptional repressor
VAAGVTSILNFAPAVLSVPEGVDVRKVDLSIELQSLAYHEQRKSQTGEGRPTPPPLQDLAVAEAAAVAVEVESA